MKNLIKKFIPKSIQKLRLKILLRRFRSKTNEEIFTEVYEKGLWEKVDENRYSSGSGTTNLNTNRYKEMVNNFLIAHDIKSIFEIGCGDFTIMKDIVGEKFSQIKYIGCDEVKQLIDYNNNKFPYDNVSFIQLDAVNADGFPKADLSIIRQVLQHLDNNQFAEILKKITHFKYLLITEHIPLNPTHKNVDKLTGPDIRLYQNSGIFLEDAPFSLKCKTLLEYREDFMILEESIPAVIRTSLITMTEKSEPSLQSVTQI